MTWWSSRGREDTWTSEGGTIGWDTTAMSELGRPVQDPCPQHSWRLVALSSLLLSTLLDHCQNQRMETHPCCQWLLHLMSRGISYSKVARIITVEFFFFFCCCFSPLEQLHTDQGKQFEYELVIEVCKLLGIHNPLSSTIGWVSWAIQLHPPDHAVHSCHGESLWLGETTATILYGKYPLYDWLFPSLLDIYGHKAQMPLEPASIRAATRPPLST